MFKIHTKYKISNHQSKVVEGILKGIQNKDKNQVLLGITGSGKTFSIANIIQKSNRPSIIITPNKTIAGQIYNEMKELFPKNAVEFFVSYYDYYQPEAYIPRTDTFIEKDASINENIDRMRYSATISLLQRRDCIVVSSVSCIYGLGDPKMFSCMSLLFEKNNTYNREEMLSNLVGLHYERNDIDFSRGNFRVKGSKVDIFPCQNDDKACRLIFDDNNVLKKIFMFDPLTLENISDLDKFYVFPNSLYSTPKSDIDRAIPLIKEELKDRIQELVKDNKILESQRLKHRVLMDIEMLSNTGMCKGIENYSRHIMGYKEGQPPATLFSYLPKDALCFIDESHITVSQISAMYNGDRIRKSNLVNYGFRLKSAFDNRPLMFSEWDDIRPSTIFVSATPAKYEIDLSQGKIFEQVIRPTGILDPVCVIKPAKNQVEDVISELKKCISNGYRALIVTLTKKMSENLVEYLKEKNYKTSYLHSEVHTLDRMKIIQNLRKGEIDVLVGINLLREGLDIPECALVAILDADKEGFLRSETSLMQTIGRCARNAEGKAILYADVITSSIKNTLKEIERRRKIQYEYNKKYNIVPTTINKSFQTFINEKDESKQSKDNDDISLNIFKNPKTLDKHIEKIKKLMLNAAKDLDFELAAKYRNQIKNIESKASMFFGK